LTASRLELQQKASHGYSKYVCPRFVAGHSQQGLPMGLQLIGKPQGDFELLQIAHAYEEAAQDLIQKRPPGI
jgi:amidase